MLFQMLCEQTGTVEFTELVCCSLVGSGHIEMVLCHKLMNGFQQDLSRGVPTL